MATIQISSSLDMHAASTWDGSVVASDSSHIEIANGPLVGTYTGSIGHGTSGSVSGTLTGYTETIGGVLAFSASGLSVPANSAEQLVDSNQDQALIEDALAGNDQFSVTPGTHVIDGYGGYNTVDEPNAYSSYTLTDSGSATVVQGAGSNDTLYNVQTVQFSDGVYDAFTHIFLPEQVSATTIAATLGNAASFSIQDATTGQSSTAGGAVFASATSDNLSITANVPNAFIMSGTGDDIITASAGGSNVLDDIGGAVNFEIGGTGNDAFFLDASKNPVSWNTIMNFHAGDFAVIYGVSPQNVAANAANGLGVPGYTGLTLETYQNGGAAFITFGGHATSDLGTSLATGFGTDPTGRPFMLVVGT